MKTLQTPQLNLITPLSPNVDNTIIFYYTDNQPVKNRAIYNRQPEQANCV